MRHGLPVALGLRLHGRELLHPLTATDMHAGGKSSNECCPPLAPGPSLFRDTSKLGPTSPAGGDGLCTGRFRAPGPIPFEPFTALASILRARCRP